MLKERCIVIPAIKKNAAIPDQLVKKLAGVPLIERSLNTARACLSSDDIFTLTDSDEIALLCERARTRFHRNQAFHFNNSDLVQDMEAFLRKLAKKYQHCIILCPSCPLLTWVDIEDAWKKYTETGATQLVTVRSVRQRIWRSSGADINPVLLELDDNSGKESFLVETRALFIINLQSFLNPSESNRVIPYFLNDRTLEIESYQDWWICERLLQRRHIVFVVAGYPAIGMGHVYRALMLAHEINNHKITFVCTSKSVLAAESIAAKDYRAIKQGEESLADTVLGLRPDLVINDFLNTGKEYMEALKKRGVQTINFEDLGTGAPYADLVINALDENGPDTPQIRRGPEYFCLRDEFAHAPRNNFNPDVRTILITFGGTDQKNFTEKVLDAVEPLCREKYLSIRIVAGPGYAHKKELEKKLLELSNPLITFTWATNVMSRMMENVDLAICSAGRTVYELCHMRVPAIVFATHEREMTHTFARMRNGFVFGGLMEKCSEKRIRNLFQAMLKEKRRLLCWVRQNNISFAGNKERVMGLILDRLEASPLN